MHWSSHWCVFPSSRSADWSTTCIQTEYINIKINISNRNTDRKSSRAVALENCQLEKQARHCYTVLHHLSIHPSSIHIYIHPSSTNIIYYSPFYIINPSLYSCHQVLVHVLSITLLQPCASHRFMSRHSGDEIKDQGGWVITPFTHKRGKKANVKGLHSLFPVRGQPVWLSSCGTLQ